MEVYTQLVRKCFKNLINISNCYYSSKKFELLCQLSGRLVYETSCSLISLMLIDFHLLCVLFTYSILLMMKMKVSDFVLVCWFSQVSNGIGVRMKNQQPCESQLSGTTRCNLLPYLRTLRLLWVSIR